jgi:NAD(P)H-flavin reductase/hemoglobin-like flavoprotein
LDADALKHTWSLAEKAGDQVPLFFYSHLFLSHPELRDLFPVSMATQRDKLVGALGRIVSHVDELDEVTGFIQQLGRDHRRFDVVAENYNAVGASLLATLKHFLGPQWTPEVAEDWAAAYGIIARVMVQAAEESEETTPAVWNAEVVSIERRSLEIAVLQVKPDEKLEYEPGQSVAVEVPQRPKLWRYLSPANVEREDGTVEFHVQLVPGGQVSASILRSLRAGQGIKIGAPIGENLTLPEDHERDLLMVAGSTGLSPLRAHLERIDRRWLETGVAPRVHLFHGSRHPWNLYEHELLSALATRPWFDYTPVVSDDPTYHGQRGLVADVAVASPSVAGRLALVCGSAPMVHHSVQALRAAGVPREDIRYERFSSEEESDPMPPHTEAGDES